MKIKFLTLVVCALLLLTACSAGNGSLDGSSAETAPPANGNTAAAGGEESLVRRNRENKEKRGSPLVDFTYVSYDTSFDWPDTVFENSLYSFRVPADWSIVSGSDYGLADGAFFIPQEADFSNFGFDSHVAVEFYNEPYYSEAQLSKHTPESIQDDFFAMQSIDFSKMAGLSKLDFYVWENIDVPVYIAEYQRSNDELTMDTTAYYVMHPNCFLVVYASSFGQGTAVPVQEAARRMVATFEPIE